MKLICRQTHLFDIQAVIQSGNKQGILIGVITVVSACSGQPLSTQLPAAAMVISTTAPSNSTLLPADGSPTADCTDTVRATLAIHAFLSNYNAGKLTDLLNQFSPAFSSYEDGSESFTGVTLTDAQQPLTEMFAKHDHMTAPDDSMTVQVETGKQTIGYYVTLNNVPRRSDSRTKDAIGSVIIGMDCITLKVNAIALQMR